MEPNEEVEEGVQNQDVGDNASAPEQAVTDVEAEAPPADTPTDTVSPNVPGDAPADSAAPASEPSEDPEDSE